MDTDRTLITEITKITTTVHRIETIILEINHKGKKWPITIYIEYWLKNKTWKSKIIKLLNYLKDYVSPIEDNLTFCLTNNSPRQHQSTSIYWALSKELKKLYWQTLQTKSPIFSTCQNCRRQKSSTRCEDSDRLQAWHTSSSVDWAMSCRTICWPTSMQTSDDH